MYGSQQAAIDADGKVVWHGKSAVDATGQYTLTGNGGVTLGGASGVLGSATEFDGNDDYLRSNYIPSGLTELSVLYYGNVGRASLVAPFGFNSSSDAAYVYTRSSDNLFGFGVESNNLQDFGFSHNTGEWHGIGVSFSSGVTDGRKKYVGGLEVDSDTHTATISATSPLDIGSRIAGNSGNSYDGDMQHFFLSETELSADWYEAQENSITSPATFWEQQVSAEVVRKGSPFFINHF